ncbi:MAG: response regulator [Alphaproteobacteria bacterium]|nr:response regulator [Alphaproteobacteria bacterium]
MSDDQPHLLVVDDDARLLALLQRFLSERDFRVSVARDGAEARAKLDALAFDLIVLDVMMPGEDGLALTRSLRAAPPSGPPAGSSEGQGRVPILLLTARGEVEDRIAGLESGADDYLAKPFEPRELVLRIKAILARARAAPPAEPAPVIRLGAHLFDVGRELLLQDGQPVKLSSAEATLLKALALARGATLSREELSQRGGMDGNPRTVDVQVTRLRKKIEPDPRVPRYLQTVRGAGYVLRPD